MKDFLQLMGILAAIALVLYLSYITSRFLGKKMAGGANNRHMKVIETMAVGPDRSLSLIRVGTKYFLFLNTKKGLELVSEIEKDSLLIEEVKEEVREPVGRFDFRQIFETYSGLGGNKQQAKKTAQPASADEEESVQASSAKDEFTGEEGSNGLSAGIKRLRRLHGRAE